MRNSVTGQLLGSEIGTEIRGQTLRLRRGHVAEKTSVSLGVKRKRSCCAVRRQSNVHITAWGFCLAYLAVMGGMLVTNIPALEGHRFWVVVLSGVSAIIGVSLIAIAGFSAIEE